MSEGLSASSLKLLTDSLEELYRDMSSWGATPPEGGWKILSKEIKSAAKEAEAILQDDGTCV